MVKGVDAMWGYIHGSPVKQPYDVLRVNSWSGSTAAITCFTAEEDGGDYVLIFR